MDQSPRIRNYARTGARQASRYQSLAMPPCGSINGAKHRHLHPGQALPPDEIITLARHDPSALRCASDDCKHAVDELTAYGCTAPSAFDIGHLEDGIMLFCVVPKSTPCFSCRSPSSVFLPPQKILDNLLNTSILHPPPKKKHVLRSLFWAPFAGMEEILHHLQSLKSQELQYLRAPRWCKISSINSSTLKSCKNPL